MLSSLPKLGAHFRPVPPDRKNNLIFSRIILVNSLSVLTVSSAEPESSSGSVEKAGSSGSPLLVVLVLPPNKRTVSLLSISLFSVKSK